MNKLNASIKLFLGIVLTVIVFSLNSCIEDCVTCEYTQPITNLEISEEICGDDEAIAAFEAAYQAEAASFGVTANCN